MMPSEVTHYLGVLCTEDGYGAYSWYGGFEPGWNKYLPIAMSIRSNLGSHEKYIRSHDGWAKGTNFIDSNSGGEAWYTKLNDLTIYKEVINPPEFYNKIVQAVQVAAPEVVVVPYFWKPDEGFVQDWDHSGPLFNKDEGEPDELPEVSSLQAGNDVQGVGPVHGRGRSADHDGKGQAIPSDQPPQDDVEANGQDPMTQGQIDGKRVCDFINELGISLGSDDGIALATAYISAVFTSAHGAELGLKMAAGMIKDAR